MRTQLRPLHGSELFFDVVCREVPKLELSKLRSEDVLSEALLLDIEALGWAPILKPPLAQLAESEGFVRGSGFEAQPLPFGLLSPTSPASFSRDGFSFSRIFDWSDDDYRIWCERNGLGGADENPCPDDGLLAVHDVGNTSTQFACVPVATQPTTGTTTLPVTNSGWSTRAYSAPQQTGNEQPGSALPGGYQLFSQPAWRIPAAGAAPGEAVIYIVIPRERPAAAQLAFQTLEGRGTARLQHHFRDYWHWDGTGPSYCEDSESGTRFFSAEYRLGRWYRWLNSASFQQTAAWQINTRATYSDGSGFPAFGAPRAVGTGDSVVNVNLTNP